MSGIEKSFSAGKDAVGWGMRCVIQSSWQRDALEQRKLATVGLREISMSEDMSGHDAVFLYKQTH